MKTNYSKFRFKTVSVSSLRCKTAFRAKKNSIIKNKDYRLCFYRGFLFTL